MSKPRQAMLDIDKIRIDGDTQPRCEIDQDAVADYATALAASENVPPVEVTFDGKDYWLWDGFHRYHACRKSGIVLVNAVVHLGTLEEARWRAVAANQTHGLRRTNADKRRAVEMAIRLRPTVSDNAIADHVGVSQPFVGQVRKSLQTVISQPARREGRDGRTINTANIGKRPAPAPPPEPPAEGDGPQPPSDSPPQGDSPTDEGGEPVPPRARGAFAGAGEFARLRRELRSLMDAVELLGRTDAGRAIHWQSVQAHLTNAMNSLWQARPAHVCPWCSGKKDECPGCKGRGWVTVTTFKAPR